MPVGGHYDWWRYSGKGRNTADIEVGTETGHVDSEGNAALAAILEHRKELLLLPYVSPPADRSRGAIFDRAKDSKTPQQVQWGHS